MELTTMLNTYTALETLLAAAMALIIGYELIGILKARRDGLSQNTSRFVTHTIMLLLVAVYAGFAFYYMPLETSLGPITTFDTPTVNVTLLVTGIMLTLLASWESFGVARARRLKLTLNASRLVSHTTVLLLILVMMGLSTHKWDVYMKRLEATYAQDIPSSTPSN